MAVRQAGARVQRRPPSGSCFAGWGPHPRAAQSHATTSAVRGDTKPTLPVFGKGRWRGAPGQRAQETRHDCEEVKVRWCRFPESSSELRGFKSGK
uniref:Uncharacterized protein n=1 Tax=Oryza sativa subsp. japonica TaxID=39947 RepID=Q5Z592_ORYSJ|nr:hypothetical protein [Oryza sativa Japonica Group]BAD69389.1 hypothetical protein [Oryza sativa Japonica Group]